MSPRLQPCPHPLCTRSHNRNCSRTERLYFLAAPVDQPDPSLRWIPLVRPHPPDQPVLSLPLFLPRPSFLADQPRLSFPPPLWFLADQLVRPLLADPPARSARSPRSPRSHQPLPRPLSLLSLPPDQSVRRCLAVRLPLSLPSFLEDRLVPSLLVVLAIPPGSDSCSHCPTLRACRWQSRVCIGPLPALARVGQGQPK